jgi:hypothetical protein
MFWLEDLSVGHAKFLKPRFSSFSSFALFHYPRFALQYDNFIVSLVSLKILMLTI